MRGIQQTLAPSLRDPREDLLGRTAESLGALRITHQHLDYFRFGCVQWPTVPSARSSTTGNGAAVGSLCRPVSSLSP